jgi:ParB family chromosome partitioning protein
VQPLVVRLLDAAELKAEKKSGEPGGSFILIAGERRWRAAQRAGLKEVPVVVKDVSAAQAFELALVENLQREDLGPIEAARAYRQLIDEFGLSQEEIAARVSRARSTVANTLRLLELDATVQDALDEGTITEGHGRALGGLPVAAQPTVLRAILERELTVREAEELVRRLRAAREATAAGDEAGPEASAPTRDPEIERVEEDLRRALGTKVTLTPTRRGGRIVIDYFGQDELARIYERLTGGAA